MSDRPAACERCGKVHDEPLCDDEAQAASLMQWAAIAAAEIHDEDPPICPSDRPADAVTPPA